MALIVEDGTRIPNANSYVSLHYSYNYLSQRNRVVSWITTGQEAQEAALIAATDYIDKRFGSKFLGQILPGNIAVPAQNIMIVTGIPLEDQTITIGSTVYTFKETAANVDEITIGASAQETAANIFLVMDSNPDVIVRNSNVVIELTASEIGPLEDDILTSSTSPFISFEYPKMEGGSLLGQQALCFPRTEFSGIPETLKMATVEYAVRALEGPLMPDPVVEETGQQVRRRSEKVGPIEEELVYQNSIGEIFKTYPEADRLIKPLISQTGGVYR